MPFKIFENHQLNSMFEVMEENEATQDSPMVGPFWYSPDTNELFGVSAVLSTDVPFYHSNDFNTDVRTGRRLHKDIWKKEQYRKPINKNFTGDYKMKPRGRVFECQ